MRLRDQSFLLCEPQGHLRAERMQGTIPLRAAFCHARSQHERVLYYTVLFCGGKRSSYHSDLTARMFGSSVFATAASSPLCSS